jgi:hypothetical protein
MADHQDLFFLQSENSKERDLNNLYFPGKVQNNQEIIIAFNFVAEVGKD